MQVPAPSSGRSILRWALELVRWLRSDRVIAGDGVQLLPTQAGRVLSVRANRFSGLVYLAGKQFDLSASEAKKWIKVDVASGTVTFTDTDPADPFPPGVEYFRTAYTYGDLHVPRFG